MFVRRRRTRFEIWTPAKLNLFLEVRRQREDGYHEIETLMVPVSLFDTLTFSSYSGPASHNRAADERSFVVSSESSKTPSSEQVGGNDSTISLSADWVPGMAMLPDCASAMGALPLSGDNLVRRAVELLRQRVMEERGRDPGPLSIGLRKRIPAAAGLGGGSSDAAAAMIGANLSWKLGWPVERLAELAGELGSDIPYFFYQSAAICRGRGEQVSRIESPLGPFHFVIVRPPRSLSTADVYRHTQVPNSPERIDGLLAGIERCRPSHWAPRLFNRLEEAAAAIAPWLEPIRQQFDKLKLLGHQLSGSGSAYFGVCRNRRQALQAAATLQSRRLGRAYCVTSVSGWPMVATHSSHN